ncbi:MAG: hypothetical protein HYT40_04025 [Candidatus Sungbacteria bacterium]|uniref:Uncharacterized protein n=1 Tax=Candidatus Sungiibacteriota bacterium TaxID=2750080 RepID=A0A931SDV8_9BACT|nr:hypothetical protein [Candidatus Sungbacteria bacterium]
MEAKPYQEMNQEEWVLWCELYRIIPYEHVGIWFEGLRVPFAVILN